MKKKRAKAMFRTALEWVSDDDVVQFEPCKFNTLTLQQLLEQYCWVVFATGFRYSVVRAKSAEISDTFGGFEPRRLTKVRLDIESLPIKYASKAEGFLAGARWIIERGLDEYKAYLLQRFAVDGDARALTELPWIGPVNKNHLAKNIGLVDVSKDDRWLVRCAAECNCEAEDLVAYLANEYGQRRHKVDTILWWYCAKYQEVP